MASVLNEKLRAHNRAQHLARNRARRRQRSHLQISASMPSPWDPSSSTDEAYAAFRCALCGQQAGGVVDLARTTDGRIETNVPVPICIQCSRQPVTGELVMKLNELVINDMARRNGGVLYQSVGCAGEKGRNST